jgi:hypothetical protein
VVAYEEEIGEHRIVQKQRWSQADQVIGPSTLVS